jgi:hypothetical protein
LQLTSNIIMDVSDKHGANGTLVLAIGLSMLVHALLLALPGVSSSIVDSSNDGPGLATSPFQISLVSLKTEISSPPSEAEIGREQLHKPAINEPPPKTDTTNFIPVADVEYFTLAELEQPPQIVQEIDTNPAGLDSYKQGGVVKLRLWIDEQGNVVDLKLVESLLPEAFIENAMESFRVAKFTAGIKSGHAVKSVVTVVVNYESA